MPPLLGIVGHTPVRVFVLFAVLLAFGVQALSPRSTAVWRLLIVPAAFIPWGAISLALKAAAAPVLIADWLAGAAMAIAPARAAALAHWDIAVSGLAAGYFSGWLARLLGKYRAAPRPAAAA